MTMTIKILGPGCRNCITLFGRVPTATALRDLPTTTSNRHCPRPSTIEGNDS